MKKTIILFFYLVSFAVFGQKLPLDEETQKVTFTDVSEVPGLKQDEIYSKVKTWISSNFRSSKSVIDLDDKEGGKIIIKGNIDVGVVKDVMTSFDGGYYNFVMTILMKDGKYKVSATNFFHNRAIDSKPTVIGCGEIENEKCGNGVTTAPNKKQWTKMKEDLQVMMAETFASLRKGMLKNEKDF